jgi:hypothetical protein
MVQKTLDFSRPKITGKTRILQKGSISIEIPWEMIHFCKTLDLPKFLEKAREISRKKWSF